MLYAAGCQGGTGDGCESMTAISLCNWAGFQPPMLRRISRIITTSRRQQLPAAATLPAAKTSVISNNDTATSQQFAVRSNDQVLRSR